MVQEADDAGLLMAIDTEGDGDDTTNNICGMTMSHTFSLIAAFTMTDG